jgi:hypothetical protein
MEVAPISTHRLVGSVVSGVDADPPRFVGREHKGEHWPHRVEVVS